MYLCNDCHFQISVSPYRTLKTLIINDVTRILIFFTPPLASATLIFTLSYVLVPHNHNPPPPNCVTSFMNAPKRFLSYVKWKPPCTYNTFLNDQIILCAMLYVRNKKCCTTIMIIPYRKDIIKILNFHIILLCTNLYHFFKGINRQSLVFLSIPKTKFQILPCKIHYLQMLLLFRQADVR